MRCTRIGNIRQSPSATLCDPLRNITVLEAHPDTRVQMLTVRTLTNSGTVRLADRRAAFLRWQAHGVCVLCLQSAVGIATQGTRSKPPDGKVWMARTSSAARRSSGKTSRQWHSQPHQLQHELQWLLLLAAAAISWFCRK